MTITWLSVGDTGVIHTQGVGADNHNKCPRYLLITKLLGKTPPIPEEMQKIFDIGNQFERDTLDTLRGKIGIREQVPFKKDVTETLRWGGKVDAITDNNLAVEVKTLTSPFKVARVFGEKQPFFFHLVQLVSYILLSEGECEGGYLVYRNSKSVSNFSTLKKAVPQGSTKAFLVTVNDMNTPITVTDTETEKKKYINLRPIHIVRFLEYMDWAFTEESFNLNIPEGVEGQASAPCFYCPYKLVCSSKIDNGFVDSKEEILAAASRVHEDLESGEVKEEEDVPF